MASKDNRFSQTEGGAMLTPTNSAQPSFDSEEIRKRENQNVASMQAQGQEAEDESQEGNDGSELDENGEKKETPEKKIVKEGAKKALEGAGVPSGAADSIVKKADEDGTLDKIVTTVKKKKASIIAGILSALTPFLIGVAQFILFIVLMMALIGIVVNKLGFIINLLSFDADVVAQYLDNIGSDALSGKAFYQLYFSVSLPNYGYVDKKTGSLSGTEQENERNIEIKRISEVIGGIMAPAISYDNTKFDEMKISEIGSIKDLEKFFGQGDVYRQVAEHACMLAYAGLKEENGQSYYETKNSNLSTYSDYEKAWDKIKNSECTGTQGFVDKINIGDIINSFWSSITGGKVGEAFENLLNDTYKKIITGEETKINESLNEHIGNYKFDTETYKKFLENYYADMLLKGLGYSGTQEGDDIIYKLGSDDENIISKKDFVDSVVSMQSSMQSTAYSKLVEHYEDSDGSGEELSLIDNLGSVYGESKCAILEHYNPLTHEYVVSKGIENDEIHSASDGEVISVVYNGENIYAKYDSQVGKCLCNGIECENSNGSEIRIKFSYDEVEYIAIYSNLAEIRVDVGDKVKKGDVIATEGNSGCANTKKLTFKIISENGISYNTNELVQKCSSFNNTASLCNFQNINVNLYDCNNEFIKVVPFYDYIKEEVYSNFAIGINSEEFLKTATLMTVTSILSENNYKIGTDELNIKNCKYQKINISEIEANNLDKAVSAVMGQVIVYNTKFANIKYSNMCDRTEKDRNANSVYNELCVKEALKLADYKTYEEILRIYYPNFYISKSYCSDYASRINAYSLNNNKEYMNFNSYSENRIERINTSLKNKIDLVKEGTRAATVEAARFLALGLEYKIPYQNGGKYFNVGFNPEWYNDGLDSSGFVSWALLNGGANIDKDMTSKELINNNIVGRLKITTELYKYYDKIQVGDFVYNENKIGIIIGKNDGILYVAEANSNFGLIVTQITSYGESDSNYSYVYFADDYYNGVGNVTSMW